MSNPASQTLLQAFLRALYDENYMPICEEEFGFVRVTGTLQTMALEAIDAMNVTEGAPQWVFEQNTDPGNGQGDYVISVKRDSYSEIEQDSNVAAMATLSAELEALKADYASLQSTIALLTETDDHTHAPGETDDHDDDDHDDDDDTKLKAALALGCTSFVLWAIAIVVMLVQFISRK